jgi:hypothetical protein
VPKSESSREPPMLHNWWPVADTQQRDAASRRRLRAGQRQRYAFWLTSRLCKVAKLKLNFGKQPDALKL